MPGDPSRDSSFDELDEELDGVPNVIISRVRLVDKIATFFGLNGVLMVDDGACPELRYVAIARSEEGEMSIPIAIYSIESFNIGIQALYDLLSQFWPTDKTVGSILAMREVDDSVAVSHDGPDGG